jgi:hypothetical protein
MEGQSEIGLTSESLDTSMIGRMREDEYESRSGSDNFDIEGISGDDQDGDDGQRKRKKRYHRHTPNQIQELESYGFIDFIFCFVFKLMLFFVIEQFCSFFLVSSKSVLILMKSKGWILVRDLAWKINKSSSGFRIVEPK